MKVKLPEIPDIARGAAVPHIVCKLQHEEELRLKAERKARLYFILGIVGTILGTIAGWLLGKFF